MILGLGLGLPFAIKSGFSAAALFALGEQGAWYDPSDMSTLFQDAAGTVPVTAVEQPVGLMLDLSGRGNHATQATTTKRPIFSGRVNLLTATEDFGNASWVKSRSSVIKNSIAAPDGTLTADTLVEDATASDSHGAWGAVTVTSGVAYTYSVYVKAKERNWIALRDYPTSRLSYFNLATGVKGSSGDGHTATITDAGNGWYRCTITFTTSYTNLTLFINLAVADLTDLYSGDGTSGIYIWGADLRPANSPQNIPAYQRVTSATDYDTVGFPVGVLFDGVDDCLVVPSLDLSMTDAVTVVAGVTKLSDAAIGMVTELTDNLASNNGAFWLCAPINAGVANCSFSAKGTTQSALTYANAAISAPSAIVVSGIADISGPSLTQKTNGALMTTSASQGTGNFSRSQLNIGARAGTSLYFNGRLYGLIVRGAQSTLSQIEAAELYIKQKMRMP